MQWILILFWICTGIAVYTYLGYGLLCYLLVKCKIHPPKNHHADVLEDLPDLTLVIFAYNEAPCIEQKIINSLNLSYPEEKKHILVVTDGSTDGTQDIALQFTNIQVLHQPERRGKAAAMNRAMTGIKSEVVVFTDANTYVHSEALIRLAAYYSDPQVGGVAGEKRVMATDASTAGKGENLYWKYESWLKRTDAELYTVVGAAGELYSIRTALYEPLPEDTILDDFVLSLQIVQKGYRFAYAPEAWSMEAPSASLREEQKRKIRICAGGFQAMRRLTPLLNIFRYGIASFQYISHRVLRWAVVPFLLPFIFLLNLWLMHAHAGSVYFFTGYAQIMFYVMAGVGYVFALQDRKMKGVYPMYYFVFMNLAVYAGLWRWIKGKQEVKWDKAKRSQSFISKYV